MKQDDPQFKLRIPPALKEKLEKAAQENTRTMGAEIVARLHATFYVKTLDNMAMFAKPALEPMVSKEAIQSLLVKNPGEQCAAAFLLISQMKELQTVIDAVLSPYIRETLETVMQERADGDAHAHTGVTPSEPPTPAPSALSKTKRLR